MPEDLEKYKKQKIPDVVFGSGVSAADFEDRKITPLDEEGRIYFADGTVINTTGSRQIIYTKEHEGLLCITVNFSDKKELIVKVDESGKVVLSNK